MIFAKIAKKMGVKRWVNLSALGAMDEYQTTAFLATKGRGDAALQCLADESFSVMIARPSLVYGVVSDFSMTFGTGKKPISAKMGDSHRLFLCLSKLPILALPKAGQYFIQPVLVQDVAKGLVNLAIYPLSYLDDILADKAMVNKPFSFVIAMTGGTVYSFAEYLRHLRYQQSKKTPLVVVSLPKMITNIMARFGDMMGLTLCNSDTFAMLEQGSVADNSHFAALINDGDTVSV